MSEKTEIHIDLDLLNTIKQDSYSEKEHPLKKYSDEIILKIFILREEYNLSFLNIARYIYSEYKFELTKGYAHTLYKKAKKSIKKDYSEKSRSSKNGGYCFSMKSPTKTHKNAKMGSAVGAENDQRKTLPKTESGGQQKTLPKESAKNSKKEVDSIRNNTENKPESTGQENMVKKMENNYFPKNENKENDGISGENEAFEEVENNHFLKNGNNKKEKEISLKENNNQNNIEDKEPLEEKSAKAPQKRQNTVSRKRATQKKQSSNSNKKIPRKSSSNKEQNKPPAPNEDNESLDVEVIGKESHKEKTLIEKLEEQKKVKFARAKRAKEIADKINTEEGITPEEYQEFERLQSFKLPKESVGLTIPKPQFCYNRY